MQFSGTVEVSTVNTLLAVSQRCLTAMLGGGERLYDHANSLYVYQLFLRL
jgi:hypothetical protein